MPVWFEHWEQILSRFRPTSELSLLNERAGEPVQVSARDGVQRVRLGPYRNRDEALAIADKVRQTLGFAPTLTTR